MGGLAPEERGGQGESIQRSGLAGGKTTAAGGGDQSRRHADVAARGKSEGRAVSGSAVVEKGLRRAHGDAGPEGHRRRTGGGAKRWRKGRHGARARGEAGGHGATRGRSRGSPRAWWQEGLTRGEPTAADFDGDRRRRAKREHFTGATGFDSLELEHLREVASSFHRSRGHGRRRERPATASDARDRARARGEM